VVGGLTSAIGDFFNNPTALEFIAKMGGERNITDAFLAMELGMTGVVSSVFGVLAVMRLRSEETSLRAEPLLSTAVGRTAWAGSHLTIALAGTAVLSMCAGLGTGVSSAVQVGDVGQFGRVFLGALVQIPAVWVIVGIVMAAFGLVPRAIVLGWVALAGFVLLGEFGAIFQLDQAVMDISPFAHVPRLPGAAFTATPLLWMTAVAAGLVALGLAGFRRRDVG